VSIAGVWVCELALRGCVNWPCVGV
jgi:hypothetical protein